MCWERKRWKKGGKILAESDPLIEKWSRETKRDKGIQLGKNHGGIGSLHWGTRKGDEWRQVEDNWETSSQHGRETKGNKSETKGRQVGDRRQGRNTEYHGGTGSLYWGKKKGQRETKTWRKSWWNHIRFGKPWEPHQLVAIFLYQTSLLRTCPPKLSLYSSIPNCSPPTIPVLPNLHPSISSLFFTSAFCVGSCSSLLHGQRKA